MHKETLQDMGGHRRRRRVRDQSAQVNGAKKQAEGKIQDARANMKDEFKERLQQRSRRHRRRDRAVDE
jgi:hypothetical protein